MKQLIIFFCALAMFAGCASTSKSGVEVRSVSKDSAAAVSLDSAALSRLSVDTLAARSEGEQHKTATETDTCSYEETVVEHIVETTDTAGNKVVTTDRTINRRGSYAGSKTHGETMAYADSQTRGSFVQTDSAVYKYGKSNVVNFESNDSVVSKLDKTTTKVSSWWTKCKDILLIFLLSIVIVSILFLIFADKFKKK